MREANRARNCAPTRRAGVAALSLATLMGIAGCSDATGNPPAGSISVPRNGPAGGETPKPKATKAGRKADKAVPQPPGRQMDL